MGSNTILNYKNDVDSCMLACAYCYVDYLRYWRYALNYNWDCYCGDFDMTVAFDTDCIPPEQVSIDFFGLSFEKKKLPFSNVV